MGLGGDLRGPSPLWESDSLMASGWWRWRGRGAAEAGHLREETPAEALVSGALQARPGAPRAPQGVGDVEWARGGPCGLLPPLQRWPGSTAMFDLGFSAKPRGKLKLPAEPPNTRAHARGGPLPAAFLPGVRPARSRHLSPGSGHHGPGRQTAGVAFSSSSAFPLEAPPGHSRSEGGGATRGASSHRGVPPSPRQGLPAREGPLRLGR